MGNLPEEEMRSFFSKAGISETQLQDQKTRKFIYDFIYKHGGIDAVKEDLHETKPPRGEIRLITNFYETRFPKKRSARSFRRNVGGATAGPRNEV